MPLGKPRDKKFQTAVLKAAFELLGERRTGHQEYPVHIYAEDGEAVACALPPQMDPTLHPAVDEAQALRPAYDRALARSKRSSIGMQISVEEVPDALDKFAKIASGEPGIQLAFLLSGR